MIRELTTLDSLKQLIATESYEIFYEMVVKEHNVYEKEYHKAFINASLLKLKGLSSPINLAVKRGFYSTWNISKYLFCFIQKIKSANKESCLKYKLPLENEYRVMEQPVIKEGKHEALYEYAFDVYSNIDNYINLNNALKDKYSQSVLWGIIKTRLTGDVRNLVYSIGEEYFDKELVNNLDNITFCDVGGYTGDTSERLMQLFPNIKKIYFYEPNYKNLEIAQNKFNKLQSNVEIVVSKAGVSSNAGKANIALEGDASSMSYAGEGAELSQIELTTLDIDIIEKIDFIKMDIEGEEKNALLGAKKHISNDNPILAISLYHRAKDIWEIPLQINKYNKYDFHIRHYTSNGLTETILYGLPCGKFG